MKKRVFAALILFFLNVCFFAAIYAQEKVVTASPVTPTAIATEFLSGALQSVQAPQTIKGPGVVSTAINLLLSLLFVIGLIFLVSVGLKYFYVRASVSFTNAGVVKILTKEFLDSKNSLYLIEFGGKVVLLGVSPDRINSLSEISDPEQVKEIREKADEFISKYKLTKKNDFSTELKNSYLKQGQKIVSSGTQVVKKIVDKMKKGGK